MKKKDQIVGKTEKKESVKLLESGKDPYQGVLTKSNSIAFVVIIFGICGLIAGLSLTVYNLLDFFRGEASFLIKKNLISILITIAGLAVLLLGAFWKSKIEKKRLRSYSSIFVIPQNKPIKEDLLEKEEKENSEDNEENSEICPLCGEKILNTKVTFCPNCGKNWKKFKAKK